MNDELCKMTSKIEIKTRTLRLKKFKEGCNRATHRSNQTSS